MSELTNRKPVVAGSFYTDNPRKLEKQIKDFFKNTKARKSGTNAVISPHAGLIFSGQTAAEAINQLDPNKKYENIFILGVSHHIQTNGASIYNIGNYEMPEFTVKVNTSLATKLIKENSVFEYNKLAHTQEHSLEIQLPFLHYHFKNDFQIIPILIGTDKISSIKEIAETLKPYFNDKNAFVISSDFSHYPTYKDAQTIDFSTANAILSKKPQKFLDALKDNTKKDVQNLATSACGWANILVLMYLAENDNSLNFEILDYKNSGDCVLGSKDKVVGYYAIALQKQQNFNLTNSEKNTLLEIARKTVNSYVTSSKIPAIDKKKLTSSLKLNIGAFVTLHKEGNLRGCVGQFMPNQPLYKVVQDMAIAASTQDSRFESVSVDELGDIDIEISVLTPLQKISSIDEIEIGRDGIYIRKGYNSGTLLPQVATDNDWDKEQFVQYCSKYKANLGADGWEDADLFIYQAIIFEE